MCFGKPVPNVVRSQAVLAIVSDGRRLLTVEQLNFDEIFVKFPGGTMEPGETRAEAASRELLQETGTEIPANKFVLLSSRTVPSPSRHGTISQHIMSARVDASVLDALERREKIWQDPTSPDRFRVSCRTEREIFRMTERDGKFLPGQRTLARLLTFRQRT